MNTTTTYNPILPLVGRVLIGVLFLTFGVMKAINIAGTTGYLTKLGFPAPEVMAYLATVVEVGGGILLIIGWKTRWAAWLLVLFVLIAIGMAHRFWELEPPRRMAEMTNFLKNLAIIGGLLFVVAFGPGKASIDKS
jgi:putative oxidoreductase